MGTRQMGYGLSRELALKTQAKYNSNDEAEIVSWITTLLNISGPDAAGPEGFQKWLKDGQILCNLMNAIQPGSIKKVHNTSTVKLAGLRVNKECENISFFLSAVTNYGLNKHDLFQTVDLYESVNLPSVQNSLFKFGSLTQTKGFDGPVIGVKIAEENKRNFSQETMQQGKAVIGLQMGQGSADCASQAGMTPYGQSRQIYNAREMKKQENMESGNL
jgi:hypothetical protein